MEKTIKLDQVRQGEVFSLDGVRWVKLDGDEEAAFVVAESELLKNCPFEREESERPDPNNFSGSNIQREVERWLRDEHSTIFKATVERPIDLTTMDGMTDYGKPFTVGRILTIDEFRKYRRHIPLVDEAYWLATGWCSLRSPYSDTHRAYGIDTDGAVGNSYVYHANFAARPALYLQSSILVSVETDEEGKSLGDYTELELLGELQRRVKR